MTSQLHFKNLSSGTLKQYCFVTGVIDDETTKFKLTFNVNRPVSEFEALLNAIKTNGSSTMVVPLENGNLRIKVIPSLVRFKLLHNGSDYIDMLFNYPNELCVQAFTDLVAALKQ